MKSPAVAPAEVEPPDPHAMDRARRVFIAGNGLPGRWQGRERFVVLETGFGLGHNFLATWDAWRQDPARCERLVFVSVEPPPPDARTWRARTPAACWLRNSLTDGHR
ncbi:hypothetical protein [Pelomonas sp. Root405]|uniref:hypothetical protein n=1 Tax=Pelomonas sp. Root405 TaxID=1736529 RepID=UPI000B19DBD7|nr:hypothetical protein [Pelomonas sp. Root405]